MTMQFSSEEVRKDLEEVFAVFGNIKETVIKTKQGSANSFAFVEFEELEDAVRALEA